MPVRSLPARPDIDHLRRQAKELHRAFRGRSASSAARVVAHHPRLRDLPIEDALAETFALADAQLVLAREYGFRSWTDLKRHTETARRIAQLTPHPRFDEALAALDAGNLDRLRGLVTEDPTLLQARTNLDPGHGYFAGATLLHHVAGNPWRDARLPDNIVQLAELLLEAGAAVEARTLGANGGTTMGLLVTGAQASLRGLTGPLMDVLLRHGASLDVSGPEALRGSLINHSIGAAEKMIELGVKPDLIAAAALGRMDWLRSFFDDRGGLQSVPRRNGAPMKARDAIGLAFLFAYVLRQTDAVEFLLERDGNWNMIGVNNGTALHRAAWAGDLPMVQRLVGLGADISDRRNPFVSTPLSWARHNRQQEVFDWMRANCPIDLHDAVCMHLPEHVQARLREDPASINRRIDQWDIPRCTPLHWAVWPRLADIEGDHAHDLESLETLVSLLLDRGADPDIIAGNGMTALDIAREGGATAIIAMLERRGANSAADLAAG